MCSERCPAVSVVVPIYNGERFLPDTIESIRQQPMTDFEVILVDDGSTDSTPAICDATAVADPRFKAVHCTNGGPSAARNLGIDNCSAPYITFIDADDMFIGDALGIMLRYAKSSGADIVAGEFLRSDRYNNNDADREYANTKKKYVELSGTQALEMGLLRKGVYLSPWGKLYRRNLFASERFAEGIIYEDLDFLSRILPRVNKFVQLPDTVYFYRQHPASFMNHWNEGLKDALTVTDSIFKSVGSISPALKRAAADRRYAAHFFILGLLYRNQVNDPATENRCLSVIKEHRREVLSNRRSRIKTRVGALVSYGGRPLIRLLSKIVYR